MKFDKYIHNLNNNNYHKEKEKFYNTFSNNINDINTHFIFFGKKNIGKYSQSLFFVNKYSLNNLKYHKKIQIDSGKIIFNIHLSDIHYEIDFNYLTHSSKTLWFSIYNTIYESAETEKKKNLLYVKTLIKSHKIY